MNSDRALRHEPKRHGIGQGWIWIRTGFDIFNKGMGASVAMIVLWFVAVSYTHLTPPTPPYV
nr:hypothetical protein [Aeromonas caviae]